ncbi:MAG: hypothetical protein ACREM3_00275 [Candidatus Rokuibacteriota bacterium]
MSATAGRPDPIGVWRPRRLRGERVFVRPPVDPLGDDWCPRRTLRPKRRGDGHRICLIGESAAAGYFYAPHVTPARVLQAQLEAVSGPGRHEVIDLARIDMRAFSGPHSLMRVAVAALQLDPDVLVIFAGNNWFSTVAPFPGADHAHFRAMAAAYREAGAPGLRQLCEAHARSYYPGVLENLAYVARTAAIAVILVIPEVNQADWQRAAPVAWLPGSRTVRWHRLLERARARAAAADHEQAARIAEQMIELDGGSCSTSHRLRASALAAWGRTKEARESCLAEIDSGNWVPGMGIPGAGHVVREIMRRGAATHGLTCVDLPEVFAARAPGLPGRALFLDYCHLTPDGMRTAMAAVAAAILKPSGGSGRGGRDWRVRLARLPEPRPSASRDATAKLTAALYNLHWDRPVDGESPLPGFWLDAALQAWDGIAETMLAYVATRVAAPAEEGLSLAEQRLFGPSNRLDDGTHPLAGEGRRLRRAWLDGAGIDAIGRALERAGDWRRRRLVTSELLDRHAAPGGGVDLVEPCHHWTPHAGAPGYQDDRTSYSAPGLYRAFWPVSDFALVADATRSLTLDATLRVPGVERPRANEGVAVEVNGVRAGMVRAGSRWQRAVIGVRRELLEAGINRISIRWPRLPPEGDAATRAILERLERGIPTDLHPVFGEAASLLVQ